MTEDQTATLRAVLADADPVGALPPIRSDQVVALAADAIDRSDRRRPSPRPLRRVLIAGAVGTAAVAIAIGALIVVPLAGGPQQDPVALEQVPGGTSAKCAAPTAEALSEYSDTMFRADVDSIIDGIVTLNVTERFVGDPGSVVEVPQGDGMMSDGGPLVFEDDASYLLAASGGVILSCGLSGVASADLEGLYADAAKLTDGTPR